MQGNLELTNVADVLLDLHRAKRSGILRISRKDVKKSIYFLDGSIVFAHSNQKSDRLGETLLRLGKISLEDFELASRDVIEKGKRLGQALTDLGLLSMPEVNSSVHYQLQQIIYSVFDWDTGVYEFVERERPVFEDIMIDISTPNLLIEGIRNITNPAVLERSYQCNEQQVLHLNNGVPRLRRTDLDFGEETLLACVDGNKSIEAVRQLAHLSSMEFDRALCSLLLSGLLQVHGETALSADTNKTQAASGNTPRFTTQRMPRQDPARLKTLSEDELRRLITITVQKFRDATHEEILNVLPGSTVEEINRAYDDLNAQFLPPFESQTRFLDFKDPLKEILDRLTTAKEQLILKVRSQMPLNDASLTHLKASDAKHNAARYESKIPSGEQQPRDRVASTENNDSKTSLPREPISELQERLKKDPVNTELLRRLGKRFFETGKPHEGEKQFLRALELEPQSIENHFALADFYQNMGLKIKAFKHLNIILQLEPNNEKAMELLNLKKARKPLYEIES